MTTGPSTIRIMPVDGQLEIWSNAGAGTEVELAIPSTIAYQASRGNGWLRFRRLRVRHECAKEAVVRLLIALCILATNIGSNLAFAAEIPTKYLTFTHLTANDGLSQSHVNAILQDRHGFMWFATHDGLNRYDGNTFVVYKNNPSDPASLSGNFITDLLEDDRGFLWIVTQTGGMSKFDPKTERFTVYRHDPSNPNSIGDGAVTGIARDAHGCLWFSTEQSGLDRFDPSTGRFTHYLNDSSGQFLDRLTSVRAGKQDDIWFVGNRGLFHLDPQTGEITRPPGTLNGLRADYVQEDGDGNLWMLAYSPAVELVKYDRRSRHSKEYPIGAGATDMINSKLLDDHGKGLWVPSSLGLYYFDRQSERFSYRFQHDETDPDSLSENGVNVIYEDRGGVLWVGTATGGVNLLNPAQERFDTYRHHSHDDNSLLGRTVYAVYADPNGILWVGYWPRALDRLDLKTGRVTHYFPGPKGKNSLGDGEDVNSIYKDRHGYLWVGGWGGGLVRFDERTGQFRRFGSNPGDAKSLNAGLITSIFGDRNGDLWVGSGDGAARVNTTTGQSADYWPEGIDRTKYGNGIWGIYPDRSGTMWFVTRPGQIIPVEETPKSPGNVPALSRHTLKPTNYFVLNIHEDRAGTLWVVGWDGLYRYNRRTETFTRYTEAQGLPSSSLGGILEDKAGKLWISTNKGISRFDPQTGNFRNYDVSDGLQADEFSKACFQAADGEMFFGGIHGVNAFYPENIRDNPHVPPVVITSFKILNKPVVIGPTSVLKNATAYTDSVTLSYRDNVFSFEFAALSYANSHKNRYRYKLENFDAAWTEVDSRQRLATYTNLDAGKYVFRVQGSNSDGVWNNEGVSLPIFITPPWWKTNWFRANCVAAALALLWLLYRLRVQQLAREFNVRVEERVHERTRIARDLHDTLLQSFQGLVFRFQAARYHLPHRPEEASEALDSALVSADQALAEGRSSIQELRADPLKESNIDEVLLAMGRELASAQNGRDAAPTLRVIVEGVRRAKRAMIREEIYRIARELLRNAYRHAHAASIEAELRYEDAAFVLIVRDDGKGIDRKVLKEHGRAGHWGLPGVYERAEGIGARLEVWSEAGAGTEARLTVPGAIAYEKSGYGGRTLVRNSESRGQRRD